MSMTDKELADAIVACGVGYVSGPHAYGLFLAEGTSERIGGPEDFVRDWRVAGALMERMNSFEVFHGGEWVMDIGMPGSNRRVAATNESLPRAICEACVAASAFAICRSCIAMLTGESDE